MKAPETVARLPSESGGRISVSRYSSRCIAIALAFDTLSQPSRLCKALLILPDMTTFEDASAGDRGGIQGLEPGFP